MSHWDAKEYLLYEVGGGGGQNRGIKHNRNKNRLIIFLIQTEGRASASQKSDAHHLEGLLTCFMCRRIIKEILIKI